MALSIIQAVEGVGDGDDTFTIGISSSPAGALIAVCVGHVTAGVTVLAVTDNQGNTYTPGVSSTTRNLAAILYCANATAGVTTITIQASTTGTSVQMRGQAVVIGGAALSSPSDGTRTANGVDTSAISVATLTPSVADSIVMGAAMIGANSSFTAGTDYTLLGTSTRLGVVYRILTSASGQTAPMGTPSDVSDWDEAAIIFKAEAAATSSLFRASSLDGLGAGGPFFHDPLAG